METTDNRDRGVEALVERTWKNDRGSAETPPVFDPDLVPVPALGESDTSQDFSGLLARLLGRFDGERAFLFLVDEEPCDALEPGECLAALDVDGDDVPAPHRKVPTDLLNRAARGREPFFRPRGAGGAGEGRVSSILVVPAVSRQRTVALLVLEHRFQDLAVEEAGLREAFLYGRFLALRFDVERLVVENESLWKDLHRLRSAPKSSVSPPALPARPLPIASAGRDGLTGDYSMIVGSSTKMIEIFQVIDRISRSRAPVLINGESGTGKELIALAVHRNSPCHNKPFVCENCAALTETLLESELFGYVRGAFTGANKDHKGLIELADGGTLFLDEVGDMSPSMQKKLLRVVQEGVIRRVGAKETTRVEVRIISATNKDLMEECRRGNFREDLYYRLNVINLSLPALRERSEDVPELVEFFLGQLAESDGGVKQLDAPALEKLCDHPWPGNVRELENEVKKLHALSDGDVIRVSDLSRNLRQGGGAEIGFRQWPSELAKLTLREATELLEREMIQHALAESGGNKSVVARALQIPKTSLYNKINKYKL